MTITVDTGSGEIGLYVTMRFLTNYTSASRKLGSVRYLAMELKR